MTSGIRAQTLLRVLNATVLGALYAALVWRARPFSSSYLAALGAGGLVLGVAVLSLFGRDPLARWASRPAFARPWVRGFFAVAPWVGLLAATVIRGSWWCQQTWALKLFATYALAGWSLIWCVAPVHVGGVAPTVPGDRPATAADRLVRDLLGGFAVLLMVIGIDGLAFGLTPFGVGISACLACAAATTAGVALLARRTARHNVAAAWFGIVLGLACAEAGIRMLHLGESLQEVDNSDYVRQFHHGTPPHSAFLNVPKPLDEFPPALVETNGLGIRGPELSPGPVDVLLIGDSLVEARQLPWEVTLGPRLAAAFSDRSAQVRVVSHGVRGWSPLLEWNWYLKVGRSLKPRTVLLFFFWNDLWVSGDEARTFRAVMQPNGRPDHFDVIVEPDWVWYKHVRAVRLAEDVLQRVGVSAIRRSISTIGQQQTDLDLASAKAAARRMAGDALLAPAEVDALLTEPMAALSPRLQQVAGSEFWPGMRPLDLWVGAQVEAAAITENELRLFAEDVAGDGGRLVVVYVPNAYQIAASECSVARYLVGLDGDRLLPEDSGVQSWLRGVAARQHIDLLDPSDAMRAFDRSKPPGSAPLYLRADCHWSASGHQFMADYLADWYLRDRAGGR